MEPLPMTVGLLITAISWPDPNEAGDTVLPSRTLLQVQALISHLVNYIEIQLARCGEPASILLAPPIKP